MDFFHSMFVVLSKAAGMGMKESSLEPVGKYLGVFSLFELFLIFIPLGRYPRTYSDLLRNRLFYDCVCYSYSA